MCGPQRPKGMLPAGTHVLLECIQSALGRFCGPMPVFRRHIVEPPRRGFCHFIVKLELARYRMFRVAGPRMMCGMGASNNRRGRIITGHKDTSSFPGLGAPAGERRDLSSTLECPAPAVSTRGAGGSASGAAEAELPSAQSRPHARRPPPRPVVGSPYGGRPAVRGSTKFGALSGRPVAMVKGRAEEVHGRGMRVAGGPDVIPVQDVLPQALVPAGGRRHKAAPAKPGGTG